MTARARMVCATDLMARSDFALSRAVLLAQRTGARLTFVHAVDPRGSERLMRAQVNRAYVQLLSKVDQAFGSAAAAIDVVVRAGGPARCHRQGCERVGCRPGRAGSTAAGATRFDFRHDRRAPVAPVKQPVLVVHRPADELSAVAMAVDLSNTSVPMIQAAARLGVLDDAQTTLLHA